MPKKNKTVLQVTLDFTKDDLKEVLRGVNTFGLEDDDNPITVKEVLNNPKLKAYIIDELQSTKDEVVEGCYEASANDWLCDIECYRK